MEKPIYVKKCAECGQEFKTEDRRQRLCSSECRLARRNKVNHAQAELAKLGRPIYHRVCPICGTEFETRYSFKKFCSEECQRRSNYPLGKLIGAKKKCERCGEEIEVRATHVKYCAKCRKAKKLEQNREYGRLYNKRPVKRVCEICGQEFEKVGNKSKYCSEECRRKAYEARHPVHHKECKICGKEFETRYGAKATCSNECAREMKRRRDAERERREHRTDGIASFPKRKVTRKCAMCGVKFEVTTAGQKHCPTCREKIYSPPEPARSSEKKTLEDWVREAQACGMSYGAYRMQVEHFGKTYEDLRK